MIRYHLSAKHVDLTSPNERAKFTDATTTGLVIPLWLKSDDQTVCSGAGDELNQESASKYVEKSILNLVTMTDDLEATAIYISERANGPHAGLPIILLPDKALIPSQQHCLVDAVKTGLCNGSTGALVGGSIGFVFGGLPGAVTGAWWVGGATGSGSALVQWNETWRSNSFRQLAAQCNDVLIDARLNGIGDTVLNNFQRICNRAGGSAEVGLVRQVVEAFEAEFGNVGAANMRAMYRLI